VPENILVQFHSEVYALTAEVNGFVLHLFLLLVYFSASPVHLCYEMICAIDVFPFHLIPFFLIPIRRVRLWLGLGIRQSGN